MPLVDVRGFNLDANVGGNLLQGFGEGQKLAQIDRNAQIRQLLGQVGQDAPQTQQQAQLSGQTAEFMGGDTAIEAPKIMSQDELIKQARQIDPALANQQLKELGLTDDLKRAEASRFASQLQNTPFGKRAGFIQARAQSLQEQGRNAKDTLELLDLDEAQQNQALTGVQLLDLSTSERFAAIKSAKSGDLKGASQKEFESLIKDFSPQDKIEARRVKSGLDPRATGSAAQTIAKEGITEKVAQSQAKIKATIKKAVVTAETKAKERGEVLTDLERSKAALPGLKTVVEQLRDLSQIATNTLGGKAWNAIVKQSGFGSTQGATARAKFIATINNQVLPLLKPTFGSAFTVEEGKALRNTMGDVDATPEEKMAQIDAFIAQKIRDIESKETQLQDPESVEPKTGAQLKSISEMTDEEIQAELAQ